MSHQVSANYTMPTVMNSLKPAATIMGAPKANSTASTTPATSTASSSSSLGSTFLSLLATELQNQDPTAPVDSTAMVGQMISLNQLDQLISINQAITGSATSSATGAAQPSAASATGVLGIPASAGAGSALSPSAQVVAMQGQLPFDPNTMMPLGSAVNNPSAISASINSLVSPTTTGSNNNSGGK